MVGSTVSEQRHVTFRFLCRTCPNCDERQPLGRILSPETGAQWPCPGCGTLLTRNVRRRLVFAMLAVAMLLASMAAAFLSSSALYVILGTVAVAFMIGSVVPAGRAKIVLGDSGPFCPHCRYHLTATVHARSTRCPECGAPMPPRAA